MKNILLVFLAVMCCMANANAQATQPADEIWYTTSDAKTVTPELSFWNDAQVISNTYGNGKGVMKFAKPLTTVGYWSFSGLSNLTSVSLPEGLQTICEYAFETNEQLTSVSFPQTLKVIELCAFRDCTSLPSISLPKGLKTIGTGAFEGCISLTSLSLPEDLTRIDAYAFINCSGIEGDLVIPNGVAKIDETTFRGCSKLTSVTVSNGSIGYQAFNKCTGLTSISLEEGVTSIGSSAFKACSNIEGELAIPSTVTSIESAAFSECGKITSVSLLEGLKSIGPFAFNGTKITSITLPCSVTELSSSAFDGCEYLDTVYVIQGNPQYYDEDAFPSRTTLCVPSTAINAYKSLYPNNNICEMTTQDYRDYAVSAINAITSANADKLTNADKEILQVLIGEIENKGCSTYDAMEYLHEACLIVEKRKELYAGYKDFIGPMAIKHNGSAIEVTDQEGNVIRLYNPMKVEFIKASADE